MKGRTSAVGIALIGLLLGLLPAGLSTVFAAPPAGASVAASRVGVDPTSADTLGGIISAPGGQFMRDEYGRAVFLHGVNAVYKRAPYELYDAPGQPFDFSAADAAKMADLGFDAVRLGIIWEGLEPGTGTANDPSICTPGAPGAPSELNVAALDTYLARVKATVDLLGSYGIYTLLDMHQDLYSSVFGGEGAPAWAVCSDGLSTAQLPGRWSHTYSSGGLDAAFGHFWTNNVVGNLQGNYDQVWGDVAAYFSSDPWIVGYDPINEPFSRSVLDLDHHALDTQIECFYTGTAHPGLGADGSALACPSNDPSVGLIPTIEAADPNHLVFYESDIFTRRGTPNFIGSMDLPRLVYNFHSYCPQRNGHTGNPTDITACAAWVAAGMARREGERSGLSSPAEPGAPPLFMSEFGASDDPALVAAQTGDADRDLLGWTYWAWKYYDDPTGSADEGLVTPAGQLEPTAASLAEAYPEAIAGTPKAFAFTPSTASFSLTYVPAPTISAPTLISVPPLTYPAGYCATVSGGVIASKPGARILEVANVSGAGVVSVSITAGRCA